MKKSLTAATAIILIIGYWFLENVDLREVRDRLGIDRQGKGASSTKAGSYDRLDSCSWIDHRNNDGDSFHVRHGDEQYEFRLHFVDAPESKVKHYRNGENNLTRIGHQGRYFGGLSVDDTTAVGSEAK